MNSIEEKICQAIDIIVSKAIGEATYDKTIQAIVVSCVDEVAGKYKVKYQDSTFYAFSTNTEVHYSANTTVYVLVPGNDMSASKTILGAVNNLGTAMMSTAVPDEDKYEKLGGSVFSSNRTYGLSSYRKGVNGTYSLLLYHKDYQPVQNYIDIDKEALLEYMKNAESIIFGGTIRTELLIEQQTRGNYGMILALDFYDNATKSVVTRTYILDVDKMTGNPYKYIYGTRQTGIYDIDAKNFIEVEYVALFTSNFPNTKSDEECVDDIFINDMEFYCAKKLPEQALNGYYLSILTPSGSYFSKEDADTAKRELEAEVMVRGKKLPNSADGLSFYWFVEDASITAESIFYCPNGGPGWRCLNTYNVTQRDDDGNIINIEWIPTTYQWIVKKSDVLANQIIYKCAAVYDENLFENTVTLTNAGSIYNLSITSDLGQQFYFDVGYPTLTCFVNNKENKNYKYYWAVRNNVGTFQSLHETTDLNTRYNDIMAQYQKIEDDLRAGRIYPNAAQSQLDALDILLEEYAETLRIDKNKVYKINVSEITSFSTYQCTVYNENSLFIGTVAIVLTNSLELEGAYNLAINNGTFVYKYDEDGVAPTSDAAEHTIAIKPLTFTIYNNLGQPIADDVAQYADIQWQVPYEDTMIIIPEEYEYVEDLENHVRIYKGLLSLTYNIANRYDVSCVNNNIKLFVNYQGLNLFAVTNFTFVKDGENGTNGTDFVCRIVANTADNLVDYPTVINGVWNFRPPSAGKYLKVQLWHNENIIFDSTQSGSSQEGKEVQVEWSILKNKYGYNNEDTSCFTINETSGLITYTGFNKSAPANIFKAKIVYDHVTYFATLPVITINNYDTSLYTVSLKYGSGFRYVTYTPDGRQPSYSNSHPFEILVSKTIDGFIEDISLSSQVTYSWEYQGTLINSIRDINLQDGFTLTPTGKNQKWVVPADDYDGQCVNNGILVTIKESGLTIAEVHIPVHLMLNRYGLSYLNDWDGNSVQVDEDGGFILAPQIGAGQKENDNSFTGVVMGKVKESGQSNASVGLFGYGKGVRTYFLDSETGKTEIGARGKGQIILDPSDNEAIIKSGNYYYHFDENPNLRGRGLEINLTTPTIKFGSTNFEVDELGHMTARGGGSIAGWTINDDELYKATVGMNSNNLDDYGREDNKKIAFWAGEEEFLKEYAPFRVNFAGEMVSTAGEIAGWKITENLIYKDNVGLSSDNSPSTNIAIWAGGYPIDDDTAPSPDDYSPKFYVTYKGHLVTTDATIGGWNVTKKLIYKGSVGLNSAHQYGNHIAFWAGADVSTNGSNNPLDYSEPSIVTDSETGEVITPKFMVQYDGTITSTKGKIAGWNITRNLLYKDSVGLNSYYNSKSPEYSIAFWAGKTPRSDSLPPSTSSSGAPPFFVTYDGKIHSVAGEIAGWEISETEITKDDVGLSSDNSKGDDAVAFWAGKPSNSKDSAPFRVNYKGEITATAGTIGGWTITDMMLYSDSNYLGQNSGVGMFSRWDKSTTLQTKASAFWAGADHEHRNAAPFMVNFEGELTAKKGHIANWIISENALYSGEVGMNSNEDKAKKNAAFWAGVMPTIEKGQGMDPDKVTPPNATNNEQNIPFMVSFDGTLISTKGYIANWVISKNAIASKNEYNVGLSNSLGWRYAIWAGAPAELITDGAYKDYIKPGYDEKTLKPTAPFAVAFDGSLYSNKGFISDWVITKNAITSEDYNVGISSSKGWRYAFWAGAPGLPQSDPYEGYIKPDFGDGNTEPPFAPAAPFAVAFDGTLYSNKGYIANWVISKNAIASNDYTIGLSNATGWRYALWIGAKGELVTDGPFKDYIKPVFGDGNTEPPFAPSAPFAVAFDGSLYANKGYVANWIICKNAIASQDYTVGLNNNLDWQYAFWAGEKGTKDPGGFVDYIRPPCGDASSNFEPLAPFMINFDGSMTATKGHIASWILTKNALCSDNYEVGLNNNRSWAYVFWAGKTGEKDPNGMKDYVKPPYDAATLESTAPFAVAFDGSMTATKGKIGGWVITETGLQNKDQTIQLLGDGTLKGKGWEIGTDGTFKGKGWEINNNTGTAHFSNIQIDSGQINGIDIKRDDNQTYFVGVIENSSISGSTMSNSTISGSTISGGRIHIENASIYASGTDHAVLNNFNLSNCYISASNCTISGKDVETYVNDLIRDYLQMHITSTSKDVVYKSASVETATRRVVTSVDFDSGTYGTDTIQVITSTTSSNGGTIKYSYYDGK